MLRTVTAREHGRLGDLRRGRLLRLPERWAMPRSPSGIHGHSNHLSTQD
jgi:hypothetical protein